MGRDVLGPRDEPHVTGPLWTPSAERVAGSNMASFRQSVNERLGLDLVDTVALHAWSLTDPNAFWQAVWDWGGVLGDPGDAAFVAADDGGHPVRDARWFPGARLSFAENLLDGRGAPGTAPAVVFAGEDGDERTVTWDDLRAEVAGAASALRGAGVEEGDRVAAWMPNVPETVVVMLATLALGAVFSSTSPDFGTAGVLDRFAQI